MIEGKIKPRRTDLPELYEIAETVAVLERVCPRAQRKAVIGEVADHFEVSTRHVYNALAEFSGDALSEIKRIRAAEHRATFDRDALERIFDNLLARK